MTAPSDLYVGDVAPKCVRFVVPADGDLTDTSIVTGAVAHVTYPGGAPTTWSLVIEAQSSSSLTLRRDLMSTDLVFAGSYTVTLSLTTPIGTYETEPGRLTIKSR